MGLLGMLSLIFMLSVIAMPRPRGMHQFRSRSRTLMVMDQGDGGLMQDTVRCARALPVLASVAPPRPAPQPALGHRQTVPQPPPHDGYARTPLLRGPPVAC